MEVLAMKLVNPPQAGRTARFEALYRAGFPLVATFVSQHKGSFQDAKDIFQDAVLIYHEQQEANPSFVTRAPAERYVLGIAKHLWLRKFKDDRRKVPMDDLESSLSIPIDFFPSPDVGRLLELLETTGKKCLELLRQCYYEKRPMGVIAKALGYRNAHSTVVQKHKCLEKIKKFVKQKSMSYEDFLE